LHSFVVAKNPVHNKFGARRENRAASTRRIVVIPVADVGKLINYAATAAAAATALDCKLAKRKQLVSSLLI